MVFFSAHDWRRYNAVCHGEDRLSGRLLHDGGKTCQLLPSQQSRKRRQGGKQGLAINLKAYPSDLLLKQHHSPGTELKSMSLWAVFHIYTIAQGEDHTL